MYPASNIWLTVYNGKIEKEKWKKRKKERKKYLLDDLPISATDRHTSIRVYVVLVSYE